MCTTFQANLPGSCSGSTGRTLWALAADAAAAACRVRCCSVDSAASQFIRWPSTLQQICTLTAETGMRCTIKSLNRNACRRQKGHMLATSQFAWRVPQDCVCRMQQHTRASACQQSMQHHAAQQMHPASHIWLQSLTLAAAPASTAASLSGRLELQHRKLLGSAASDHPPLPPAAARLQQHTQHACLHITNLWVCNCSCTTVTARTACQLSHVRSE